MDEAGFGLVAVPRLRSATDAQLRHFQRLELDLDGGDLGAEAFVGDQRLAAGLLERGELLEAADARLGNADAGDAGALVAEQKLGVVPALVLLADQILGRHLHVVEEHLVDFVAAVDGLDRAHGDAGRLHVDQQEGNAFLLLRRPDRCAPGRRSSRRTARSVVQVFWPLTT